MSVWTCDETKYVNIVKVELSRGGGGRGKKFGARSIGTQSVPVTVSSMHTVSVSRRNLKLLLSRQGLRERKGEREWRECAWKEGGKGRQARKAREMEVRERQIEGRKEGGRGGE